MPTSPTPSAPPYQLLACDLDGTLLKDDLTISQPVRRALATVQSRGIQLTLATGRGFSQTRSYAQELNITAPLICYQGGLIQHPQNGQILYRATMERNLGLQAVQVAHMHDWHLVVYMDNNLYLEELCHPVSFYHKFLGTELNVVDDLSIAIRENETSPTKFLFVAESDQADEIEAKLNAQFEDRLIIVRSHERFVEGNPLGVNKGKALQRLAQFLDIPQSHVVAIGDQANDTSMISWAGLGIAMENGSRDARSAADWIAPPVTADGVAVAIHRFFT